MQLNAYKRIIKANAFKFPFIFILANFEVVVFFRHTYVIQFDSLYNMYKIQDVV
jgi:hypothetical protein